MAEAVDDTDDLSFRFQAIFEFWFWWF
jgi:hypothetical protein